MLISFFQNTATNKFLEIKLSLILVLVEGWEIMPLSETEGARQLFTLVGTARYEHSDHPFVHTILYIIKFQNIIQQVVQL